MPRHYIRKTNRGHYGSETLKAALAELENNTSLKKVAEKYGIDRKTLRRHRDKKVSNPGTLTLGRYKPQLNAEFEIALCHKIKTMESLMFGMSLIDVRRLAYDLAEKLGLNHRFNKEKKLAGHDWLFRFLQRNPTLSLRRPESVSLSRAVGFNRPQVTRLFVYFKSVLETCSFSASKIWNMDETGFSCVQKPGKILATKGKKAVGKMTSAERGKNVTAICDFNAAGTCIPPMLIFPRKRWDSNLMKGSPAEAIGTCTDNGWSDADQFIKWFHHFAQHAKPSIEEPHIIILDGHHSHKTLQAVELASEKGIHMISLPPHCTHKLQPGDHSFFKPLKAAYNSFADSWMLSHPGQRTTFFDIAEIFGQAFNKVATVGIAANGFAACGIWPFNDIIFTDEDFAPSQVTDVPDPVCELLVPTSLPTVPVADTVVPIPSASKDTQLPSLQMDVTYLFVAGPSSPNRDQPATILENLCGTPKSVLERKRTRRAENAQVLTGSPFKKSLREKEEMKQAKSH